MIFAAVNPIVTIAVTGPESSGKTTLCRALAEVLNGICVEEYARAYLNALNRPYHKADLTAIARGQAEALSQALSQASQDGISFVICDTDMAVMHLWSDEKYGSFDDAILKLEEAERFDLTFLCSPEGIDWEFDPLRENPLDRIRLFLRYLKHFRTRRITPLVLTGSLEERVAAALQTIDARSANQALASSEP